MKGEQEKSFWKETFKKWYFWVISLCWEFFPSINALGRLQSLLASNIKETTRTAKTIEQNIIPTIKIFLFIFLWCYIGIKL